MEKSLEKILLRALEITSDAELKKRINEALPTGDDGVEAIISTMEKEVKDERLVLDHLGLLEKQLDDIDSMLADMRQRLTDIKDISRNPF